jgi:hypothetical protein
MALTVTTWATQADAPTRDALLSPTAAAGWVRAQRVVRCAAALVELPNALVAAGAAHTGDGLSKQARDAIAGPAPPPFPACVHARTRSRAHALHVVLPILGGRTQERWQRSSRTSAS